MILLDTSIWIDVFRARRPLDLEAVVDFDEVVTCLPVVQEVCQGFRDESAYRRSRDAMLSLPIVESPMDASVFLQAAELYRGARRGGFTVRSSVDCVIAACAIRHDLEVLHRDRDFTALAKVSSLRQRTP
ncbi:MAG: PIN domain-containing protein [Myxococcota bacterium]|nr:PIN domain-containing protein [Myxococcota bacterium]